MRTYLHLLPLLLISIAYSCNQPRNSPADLQHIGHDEYQFINGFPTAETTQKVYDQLDFQRAVQVYLRHIPAMSMYGAYSGILNELEGSSAFPQRVALWEDKLDAKTPLLTGNTEVVYSWTYIDLRDGPVVIEVPPGVLAFVDDMWMRYVTDMGFPGPDKGKGGKYLILPPDYNGNIPEGYFVSTSTSYLNWVLLRGFLVDGKPDQSVASLKKMRIYSLDEMASPPEMEYINASGLPVNTLMREDIGFYEDLAALINHEFSGALDPEEFGMLASIGIIKGEPFAPDDRMKRILQKAAETARATAITLMWDNRDENKYFYKDKQWTKPWIGGTYDFMVHGKYRYLDARTLFYWFATGNTPAMVQKNIGSGSQYLACANDSNGDYFDGSKLYKLRIDADVPVENFWSLIMYDVDSRSMLIREDIQAGKDFPSVNSYADLKKNVDGSIDIYLGPEAPEGYENNFIQTVPGKGFFFLFRLYSPTQAYFDQSWQLNDVELVAR